jgi:hypothetical protein
MRRFIAVVAFGVLLAAATQPAAADPIPILSGNLNFDSGDPPSFRFGLGQAPFNLGGVLFESNPETGSLLVFPPGSAVACLFVNPCPAGSQVNLGITITGRGLARMGNAVDSDDPDLSRPAEATFQFRTPDRLLDGSSAEIVLVEAPFEFDGVLKLFSDTSFSNAIFETTLVGRGTATADMERGSVQSPFVWEESVFTFESATAPVPEPATFTLLATGLSALWLRRRRRQDHQLQSNPDRSD